MQEDGQSTIKLSNSTKARLKNIADSRGRKESYEQIVLELLDNRKAYMKMQMDNANGR